MEINIHELTVSWLDENKTIIIATEKHAYVVSLTWGSDLTSSSIKLKMTHTSLWFFINCRIAPFFSTMPACSCGNVSVSVSVSVGVRVAVLVWVWCACVVQWDKKQTEEEEDRGSEGGMYIPVIMKR